MMLKEHITKIINKELKPVLEELDARIKKVEEYEKNLISFFDDVKKNIDSAVKEEIKNRLNIELKKYEEEK